VHFKWHDDVHDCINRIWKFALTLGSHFDKVARHSLAAQICIEWPHRPKKWANNRPPSNSPVRHFIVRVGHHPPEVPRSVLQDRPWSYRKDSTNLFIVKYVLLSHTLVVPNSNEY